MNVVYLAFIMTGVNLLAPTPDLMISSMRTISSPISKRGAWWCHICNLFVYLNLYSSIFPRRNIHNKFCEPFWYDNLISLGHITGLNRCNLVALVAEVDRILRPGGKLIVRDHVETINAVESMVRAMQWEVRLTYSKDNEGLLCVQKSMWRPSESEMISYAIA